MIDFDALVLAPCHGVLAIGVVVYPEISRPGDPPYPASGVFSSQPLTVEMQDGTVFSDQQTTLEVRTSQFKHMPARSDRIRINEPVHPYHGRRFWIWDVSGDGQGGAILNLRETEPT